MVLICLGPLPPDFGFLLCFPSLRFRPPSLHFCLFLVLPQSFHFLCMFLHLRPSGSHSFLLLSLPFLFSLSSSLSSSLPGPALLDIGAQIELRGWCSRI